MVDGEGLYLYEQTADTIMNNHFHGYYGVYDEQSHRQAYSGNTSNGNEYGFYLYCNDYGTVNASGNTANNNGTYGFYTYDCYVVDHPVDGYTGSRIVGNTASGNGTGSTTTAATTQPLGATSPTTIRTTGSISAPRRARRSRSTMRVATATAGLSLTATTAGTTSLRSTTTQPRRTPTGCTRATVSRMRPATWPR